MTMSSGFFSGLPPSLNLDPIEHLWDMEEWGIHGMNVQLTNMQVCEVQSCQHGPEDLRNVFSILWNPCQEEVRLFREQRKTLTQCKRITPTEDLCQF